MTAPTSSSDVFWTPELERRFKEGLKKARTMLESAQYEERIPRSCQHRTCTRCRGTGIDQQGELCVHMISCSCSHCSPTC